MAHQLSFDLSARPALGRDDLFVSPANAMAVALMDSWPNWPARKLALIGPRGAGKTHLAHVWAAQSGAQIISAAMLQQADIPTLARGPVAVEDVPAIADNPDAQNALFHLHNLTLAEGHSLLFTGHAEPQHWHLTLPDLASRMQGTPVARLDAPDDALLSAILMKLFADRQIAPAPDLIPYVLRRMDRSFDAAQTVVARLDAAALDAGRPLTRRFAAQVLDNSEK